MINFEIQTAASLQRNWKRQKFTTTMSGRGRQVPGNRRPGQTHAKAGRDPKQLGKPCVVGWRQSQCAHEAEGTRDSWVIQPGCANWALPIRGERSGPGYLPEQFSAELGASGRNSIPGCRELHAVRRKLWSRSTNDGGTRGRHDSRADLLRAIARAQGGQCFFFFDLVAPACPRPRPATLDRFCRPGPHSSGNLGWSNTV